MKGGIGTSTMLDELLELGPVQPDSLDPFSFDQRENSSLSVSLARSRARFL